MVRNAGRPDDIDHASQTGGRIDDETDRRSPGSRRAQLQDVVDHHPRFAEIDQNVVERFANWSWREKPEDGADRTKAMARQLHLNCETLAIEALERIVDPGAYALGGVADAGVADGDQQHHRRRRMNPGRDAPSPGFGIVGSDRLFEQCHHRRLKLTGRLLKRMEALVGNRPSRRPCIMWRPPRWQSAPARFRGARERGAS